MTKPAVELLVLDVHGVVLNDRFPRFLAEVASHTGESVAEIQQRWRDDLRTSAWIGEIDDRELWQRLTRGGDAEAFRQALEAGYQLGPAAPHLAYWSTRVPIWLLSNHRTAWLLPRLSRFGIHDHFERVLVSDAIGAVKPDARAFDMVCNRVSLPQAAVFVDDKTRNVKAARRRGSAGCSSRRVRRTGSPP